MTYSWIVSIDPALFAEGLLFEREKELHMQAMPAFTGDITLLFSSPEPKPLGEFKRRFLTRYEAILGYPLGYPEYNCKCAECVHVWKTEPKLKEQTCTSHLEREAFTLKESEEERTRTSLAYENCECKYCRAIREREAQVKKQNEEQVLEEEYNSGTST